MKLITVKDKLKTVAWRYKVNHFDGSEWNHSEGIYDALIERGDTLTVDDVVEIMGDERYVLLTCDKCGRDDDTLVLMKYDSGNGTCALCISEAHELVKHLL